METLLSKEDEKRVRSALGCPCDECFTFYYPRFVTLSPQCIEVKTIGYYCSRIRKIWEQDRKDGNK